MTGEGAEKFRESRSKFEVLSKALISVARAATVSQEARHLLSAFKADPQRTVASHSNYDYLVTVLHVP